MFYIILKVFENELTTALKIVQITGIPYSYAIGKALAWRSEIIVFGLQSRLQPVL